MFQSLRTNNQLYILHKDANPFIEYGPVVSVSAPKPKYPMASPMGQLPQNGKWLWMLLSASTGRTRHSKIFLPAWI